MLDWYNVYQVAPRPRTGPAALHPRATTSRSAGPCVVGAAQRAARGSDASPPTPLQTAATPSIAKLPWYMSVGNHEGPTPGGTDKLIFDYPAMNSNFRMPARYYSVLLQGQGVSVLVLVLNNFPCVTAYPSKATTTVTAAGLTLPVKANTKYGTTREFQATSTAQYINSMYSWAAGVLNSTTATYTLIVAHFPMFGTKTQWGDVTQTFGTGTTAGTLPSYPGTANCGALLNGLIQTYKPAYWVNGHDHVEGVSMNANNPADPTLYITNGAGSLIAGADGYSPTNPNSAGLSNVLFSADQVTTANAGLKGTLSSAGGGFTLFTATASAFTAEVVIPMAGNSDWSYPMQCDVGYYQQFINGTAGIANPTMASASIAPVTTASINASYIAASGVPSSVGWQLEGPFLAGCVPCSSASLDTSGTYSAACSLPAPWNQARRPSRRRSPVLSTLPVAGTASSAAHLQAKRRPPLGAHAGERQLHSEPRVCGALHHCAAQPADQPAIWRLHLLYARKRGLRHL